MEKLLTLPIGLLTVLVFCSVGDEAKGRARPDDHGGRSIHMWMIPGDTRIRPGLVSEEFALFRRAQASFDVLPEDRIAGADEFLLALSEEDGIDAPGTILSNESRMLDSHLGSGSESFYASLTENGWLCLVPPRDRGAIQCSRDLVLGTVLLGLSPTKLGARAYGLAADRVEELTFSAGERKWRALPRANAFIVALEPTDSIDDVEIRFENGDSRAVRLAVDLRQS